MKSTQGSFDPKYVGVEAAFTQGLVSEQEVGASVAVIRDGETVVDLWGGCTDRDRTQPWREDTISCCFSISKAITAICLLQAVDRGHLELDQPIAGLWPEFGTNDKQDITLRHVLSHQAGLPGFHEPVDASLFYEWDAVCEALARESVWWPPGSAHGYHARSFGFLCGEVLRRATGKSVTGWLREHITDPYNIDFHFQLDQSAQARCADMLPAKLGSFPQDQLTEAQRQMAAVFTDTSTPTGAAFQNPQFGPGYMNQQDFREALMPASSGHGNARSVAQIFSRLPELLSAEILAEAGRTQTEGADRVLFTHTRMGLGFMLHEDSARIGWHGCMGHAGAGGSIGFYDPDTKVAFAFVMNQMQEGAVTSGMTAQACIDALFSCLN